ncbi:flagellar basal body P-ring protein [Nitrospira sp. KM1]|uniref:flagellar basal body P-ring protein FlgI n=1 Tax=Nitrospira sp. KM1 TaxID=1936990 RepID=UPI0013A72601|nr:flagellar basal body P-ring protein FlgI [Nitrospira sp. KM1]BCA54792.1 flagellar basal body P-ring protein [Nitrospira sp. KM1]
MKQPCLSEQFRAVALMVGMLVTGWATSADAVRIKDIGTIEGVRDNQLIGYGLVVGLDRTGDQVIGGQFTIQAMMSMLNKMGINLVIDPIQLLTRNIASVMVTAKLPPFTKPGMSLDVVVSSMANAKSLQGGTLLLTPLKAPNQQVFAVAQGPISIGGFLGGTGGPGGATVSKNHQAAGVVPGGAIVEKELAVNMEQWESVSLLLRQADFTTSIRTAEAIDNAFGRGTAVPVNAGSVKSAVPSSFQGRIVEFIATLEALDVAVDAPAKVVVNERTGTVVLGEHVRISTCAISHGNLTISVKNTLNVSQPPAPLIGSTGGTTTVTPDVQTDVKEQEARLVVVDATVTLGEVVSALNAVGVTPRDLVAILSALKSAGALQAALEII